MGPTPAFTVLQYLAAERIRAAAGRPARGLHAGDVLTLAALYDAGATSAAVLADRLLTSVAQVHGAVERLAAAGYAEAEHGEVWLTPSGRRLRRLLSRATRRTPLRLPSTPANVSLN